MSASPEEFTLTDLSSLRRELLASGLDSWQAGELVGAFLAQRGYTVSHDTARSAALEIEAAGCNLDCMRAKLNSLALFI